MVKSAEQAVEVDVAGEEVALRNGEASRRRGRGLLYNFPPAMSLSS
jgi:hypothetical protein